MIRVGVDVGGTFTDVVLERTGGREQQVVVAKVPSTPADQSEGVVQGILKVCALAGVEPGAIDAVFHGTTVATNMVIERAGAEVGMMTTRGFRDILHMARHKRRAVLKCVFRCSSSLSRSESRPFGLRPAGLVILLLAPAQVPPRYALVARASPASRGACSRM